MAQKTDTTALPDVAPAAVHELYSDLLDADRNGASGNDVAQLLDDWFVEQGYPTVIYRHGE